MQHTLFRYFQPYSRTKEVAWVGIICHTTGILLFLGFFIGVLASTRDPSTINTHHLVAWSPVMYFCVTTFAHREIYTGCVLFIVLTSLCLAAAVFRTLGRGWRYLMLVQWRSLFFLLHFLVVFISLVLDRLYVGTLIDTLIAFRYPTCVGENPRTETPPCQYQSLNLFGYLLYLLFVMMSFPLACIYVYLTSSITLQWWGALLFQRRVVRTTHHFSTANLTTESSKE